MPGCRSLSGRALVLAVRLPGAGLWMDEDEEMVLAATGSTPRSGLRRPLVALGVAAVVTVVLAAGYVLGFRLNLQTRPVPVPTAAASPEEVCAPTPRPTTIETSPR